MIRATMSMGPAEQADHVQGEENDAREQRVAPPPYGVDQLRATAGEENDRRQHHRSRVPRDDQHRQPERDDPQRPGADGSDHEVEGVAERVHRLAQDGDRPIAAGDEAVDRVQKADRSSDAAPQREPEAPGQRQGSEQQHRNTRVTANCGQPIGDAVAIDRDALRGSEQRGTADHTDRDHRPPDRGGDDREGQRAVAVHQRHISGQRFAECEPEQSPEEQRSSEVCAAAKACQRCPVEAG